MTDRGPIEDAMRREPAPRRAWLKRMLVHRSIAFRLIVAVLAVELLSAVLVVALSYGYERHIHFRAFDVMLHGRSDSILGAVEDAEDPGDHLMLSQNDLHVPPEDVYEVWDQEGKLLGRSQNWQGTASEQATETGDAQGKPPGPHGEPFRGEMLKMTVNGEPYLVLRMRGSRTVDPSDQGGKVRTVTILYGSPAVHLWHAVHGAVEFYALGSVALLLVTGPLIGWLLHRGLLPLRQLAALAAGVSVDSWNFSPPESARTTPELAPLTQALESVLARLERSFEQQRTFVSDAAHELKTAVAVQKSSLQLLSMKRRSAQEYQAGLDRCLGDSERLEKLVADMLTLARAESAPGDDGPRPEADLAECVRQVARQLETVAAMRQVRVELEGAAKPEAVESIRMRASAEDGALLVSNLLLNALQHSPAGSAVEVRLTRAEETAQLTILDHGDGIPAAALPHVFDRFYRGDPSRTRNTGGTGLGLSIAKAIVTRAGGTIAIVSQADPNLPGQGTAVTVSLPVFSGP